MCYSCHQCGDKNIPKGGPHPSRVFRPRQAGLEAWEPEWAPASSIGPQHLGEERARPSKPTDRHTQGADTIPSVTDSHKLPFSQQSVPREDSGGGHGNSHRWAVRVTFHVRLTIILLTTNESPVPVALFPASLTGMTRFT